MEQADHAPDEGQRLKKREARRNVMVCVKREMKRGRLESRDGQWKMDVLDGRTEP